MSGRARAPVTAIVAAYRRIEQTLATLERIQRCEPPPAEIVVHVDGGEAPCAAAIAAAHPTVRIIVTQQNIGPGGGRNKLVAASSQDIVASFDDDSWPADPDYFARLLHVFQSRPDAQAIASRITEKGSEMAQATAEVGVAVHFGGGGVAYRRGAFLASGGYVALPVAYGMEEVDLCLRYLDRGFAICYSPWLRVFHDNDLSHHGSPAITSASIANLALLTYLRYPVVYWPYGAMQVARRVAWLVGAGRTSGILSGLARIPGHIWRHRALRGPVKARTLMEFIRARREPVRLEPLAGDGGA